MAAGDDPPADETPEERRARWGSVAPVGKMIRTVDTAHGRGEEYITSKGDRHIHHEVTPLGVPMGGQD